ncbi:glycosyltransferase family 4 protein [Neisseria meningitidis]|uniref:glycosyltransferase family 4 protein n=1 Tax=Neisseria meningitidis TaxID=487 RepID=UPI000E57835D|nr:glycosyltransferase family 4 protein [Neisseria meningitidis]
MKIVFITTVASSIYGFRAPVIKKLIGKNHQVYAFVSEFSDNELDIIREMGVTPVTYRSNRSGLNPFSDIKSTFLIFKELKKISPDLVFPYFAKPVIFGTFAAKLAGVPRIVGMLEGLGFAFTPQPEGIPLKTKIIKGILIALYHIALPMLESLIVLNPDDKDELTDKYGIKIKNIHILGGIGLDLRQYPYSEADIPDEKEPVKFLFIGRLLKEKGIDEFIRAAEQVKDKYPDTVFTALGAIDKSRGGGGGGDLEPLIPRDFIRFPGFGKNFSEVKKAHHIFVLPFYREGVPRSTQEAMAGGRGGIKRGVPGCRETVADKVNGFLIEPWNPRILAEKMIYFIENREAVRLMGNASYAIAKDKFDAEKVDLKLLDILKA